MRLAIPMLVGLVGTACGGDQGHGAETGTTSIAASTSRTPQDDSSSGHLPTDAGDGDETSSGGGESSSGGEPVHCASARAAAAIESDAYFRRVGLIGMAVSVATAGCEPWSDAWGLADVAANTPLTPLFVMRAASVTKSYTAALILKLAEDDLLTLDDTLQDLEIDIPSGGEITVRQLLNQTSGLADYQSNDTFLQAIVADPLRVWEPQELVDLAVELGQVSPPGAAHVYSNANFVLAGLIVESVTGQAYHDVLRENLLSPLGLEQTWLEGHEIWDEPTAHGYVVVDAGRPIDITNQYHASQVWSAGAMVATVGDLRRWMVALLNSDFLAPESQAELAQFVPAGAIQYGLGVFAVEQEGYVVYGHNGAVGGFQSAAFIDPGTGISVAVLQDQLTVVAGAIDSDPTALAVRVIAAVADVVP